MKALRAIVSIAVLLLASTVRAQHVLIPMDDAQQNHLKSYGLAFTTLKAGNRVEWFLNYRGGSFLLVDEPATRRKASLDGVTFEAIGDASLAQVRREIAAGNMDAVSLEKAPRIAIYAPPKSPPWDDAVTLALKYAGIEFTQIWDDEVLKSDLTKFEGSICTTRISLASTRNSRLPLRAHRGCRR